MNLKLPPVKRFLALVACFVFCLGLLPNTAYAVTPQEGWFISGTMERDGINYYIIDNKLNAQKWWVDLSGGLLVLDETFESGYIDTSGNLIGIASGVNSLLYASEGWYGFSGDGDFRIDNDWLIEVSVSSFTAEQYNFAGSTQTINQFTLVALDRSKIPTIAVDYKSLADGDYGVYDAVFSLEFPPSNMYPYFGMSAISVGPVIYRDQIGSTLYFPCSNFSMGGLGADTSSNDKYPTLSDFAVTYSSLDGCNINDLLIFPIGGFLNGGHVESRLAFRFLCPVDKAPSGMAVGDRWPKVWPLEVEMEDAYQEYYNAMLDWSQTPTPDSIHNKFDSMSIWGDDSLGALEFDDQQSEFVGNAFALVAPLVQLLFPFLFLGILALIFVNKAMH